MAMEKELEIVCKTAMDGQHVLNVPAPLYAGQRYGLFDDGQDGQDGFVILAPWAHRLCTPLVSFTSFGLSAVVFPALQAAATVRLQPGRERRGCPFERLQFFVKPNEQPQGDRDREADLSDHLRQFHVVSRRG